MSSLIRKSPDHWLCAPTRSLSQLITSFIGSWCQGIHHAPFVAWPIFIWLFFHNQNSVLTIFQVKTIQSFFQSFAFNITKNISWLTSQYVWSYILSFYMQFSKNIYFVINVVLLCQLRRSAPHLSNKLRCSLLASAYYSFLTKYLFEKHGFSKLNRNVNINNSYTK